MNADDVPIRRPCPLRAPTFDGNGACLHCRETVTDLSAGTAEEARAWLASRSKGGCVAYRTDAAGRLRFGLRSVVTGALASAAAATASVAPLAAVPVGAPSVQHEAQVARVEAPVARAAPDLPAVSPDDAVAARSTHAGDTSDLSDDALAEMLSEIGYVAE